MIIELLIFLNSQNIHGSKKQCETLADSLATLTSIESLAGELEKPSIVLYDIKLLIEECKK